MLGNAAAAAFNASLFVNGIGGWVLFWLLSQMVECSLGLIFFLVCGCYADVTKETYPFYNGALSVVG